MVHKRRENSLSCCLAEFLHASRASDTVGLRKHPAEMDGSRDPSSAGAFTPRYP